MRQTIAGWVAGAALAVAMGSAPAAACAVVDPCSPNYQGAYRGGYHHHGYAERLPDPTGPQYYYVNHGPTYTGPGNLAPEPTYQERAVIGWKAYHHRPYRRHYRGGPYANPTTHYYHGAPRVHGPAVYTYQPRRSHFRPRPAAKTKYYYTERQGYGPAVRPGIAPRFYGPKTMAHGPRAHTNPRYAAPRQSAPRLTKPGSVTKPQI